MNIVLPAFIRDHLAELFLVLFWMAVFSILALLKKRFIAKGSRWPSVRAKIENVFVELDSNKTESTHAILAYSYSVDGSYYSGQIRLFACGSSVELLEKEMVGKEISVHYSPERPAVSVFTKHKVRGWNVA